MLATDGERGLTRQEAGRRLEKVGPNSIARKKRVPAWRLFLSQFDDFMSLVLLGATAVSGLLGEVADALTIIAIVILNAWLGFLQEYRAERSLEALRALSAPTARVLREGQEETVPAHLVVPGDILLLEAGDRVAADARILEAHRAEAEEAALTGESVPVRKVAGVLPAERPLGDRRNLVYAGTTITRGRVKAVVVATGMNTEMGRIAGLIHEADEGPTPLQRRLDELGRRLVWGCLAVCALVATLGVMRGEAPYFMLLSGVSLAVAAIPEGLPAVVTICLALGVQRMSRRNAIVRRLPAVETLGCATVICADKTGTITRNEMTVQYLWVPGGEWRVTGEGYQPRGSFQPVTADAHTDAAPPTRKSATAALPRQVEMALMAGALCNDARLVHRNRDHEVQGDPTEAALLVAAAKAGLWREELERQWPRVGEIPFEPERRCMSVVHRGRGGKYVAFVKGAPDVIVRMARGALGPRGTVPLDRALAAEIAARNEAYGRRALRVLALAYRELDALPPDISPETVERDLVFLGLAAMADPPRPEARRAVATCRRAGIATVMITGDHPATARAVAEQVGMLSPGDRMLSGAEVEMMTEERLRDLAPSVRVYARASAAHKLRIVRALKSRGHVVAMTGDGVNDAPALKEANIGVAMGLTGTEVSREASAMVLQDDNFATLVAAVAEGRAIYDNVRKFVRYLLSCNVGEVLVMLGATLARLPIPLLPIQMLWVNLVTDGLPALALSVEPAEPDVMNRPPRSPQESIFARGLLWRILGRGLFIGLASLAVFCWGLYAPASSGGASGPVIVGADVAVPNLDGARTMAFACLVIAQLVHAFHCRSETRSLLESSPGGNPALVGAVAVSLAMLLAVIYLPWVAPFFHTVPLGWQQWVVVLAGALAGDVLGLFGRLIFPRS
ncbi:MAG: cation-translocating P-type ATPase [Firmicutes bacterium]|nr:cation-translocating P-type ATPase [Bacillota bacterium]